METKDLSIEELRTKRDKIQERLEEEIGASA